MCRNVILPNIIVQNDLLPNAILPNVFSIVILQNVIVQNVILPSDKTSKHLSPKRHSAKIGSPHLSLKWNRYLKTFFRVIYVNFGVNLDFRYANIVVNYAEEKFYNIGLAK
jgi:hypothetical protein